MTDHGLKLDGLRRPVFVAHDLFRIEVINALILRRVAAVCETFADVLEDSHEIICEVTAEDGRLGGTVVGEHTGLGTDLDNLALLDDDHALSVVDGNAGAAADDVVRRARVGAVPTDTLLPLCNKGVLIETVAVEIFFPLVGEHSADGADCCLDKPHRISSFAE